MNLKVSKSCPVYIFKCFFIQWLVPSKQARYRELLICEFKSLGTDLTTLSPAPGASAASTASTAHTYFT